MDLTTLTNRCNDAATSTRTALELLVTSLRTAAIVVGQEKEALQKVGNQLPSLVIPNLDGSPLGTALASVQSDLDVACREVSRQMVSLVQLEEALRDMADDVASAVASLPRPLEVAPAHEEPAMPSTGDPKATYRVIRGGHWPQAGSYCHSCATEGKEAEDAILYAISRAKKGGVSG